MNRRTKSTALALLILLEFHVLRSDGELRTRQIFLTKTTGDECQTQQIGEPWIASSPSICYMECMLRYPDTCQSCVYNTDSQLCRPGSVAFRPLETNTTAIPEKNSSDTIFYAKQPISPCNTRGMFRLFEICGSTLCLSPTFFKGNYTQAKKHCEQVNSALFIANTMARFSAFWHISRDYFYYDTWLGMTDISEEGKFVWDNGEPLSDEMNKYIWGTNQPDDTGGEDCTEIIHPARWIPIGINDVGCDKEKYFICEPYNAYNAK